MPTLDQNVKWLLLGSLLVACGGNTSRGGATFSATTSSVSAADLARCKPEGKRVVQLDLNKDKKPDVWKLFATRTDGGSKVEVLTCKEIDLNFDGRSDIWIYYADDGNRQMEEMDLDFDGRMDMVTFRKGGKIVRQELDTNYDGKPDIWKYYEDDALVRVDRDTQGSGRVDYWEYYEGGRLDRVGYDKDGDAKVDVWDRPPAGSTPAAASGEGSQQKPAATGAAGAEKIE